MEKTRLGRTNLMVSRTSFGALPIQRTGLEEAKIILRKAYEGGINFFDTARHYTDSEMKIGVALGDVRQNIYIATKTYAKDPQAFWRDLEYSLKELRTDYIDIYQFHNIENVPEPTGENGLYQAMLDARRKGMIRFIGISCHKLANGIKAAQSGLYDTVQFPLSSISTDEELKIIDICRENDVGLIGMKALAGGIITKPAVSFAFLRQYPNVVPIWGIQHEWELDEILELERHPPVLDQEMQEIIRKDKAELGLTFCRACGYCLPCPADIPIPMAARMAFLLRRSQYRELITDEWQEKMERIENCTSCNHCAEHCPYNLDTPRLLRFMLDDYRKFCMEHKEN